jgi:glyoxylase-like metal-dependent hydrolase (beta-lactamase superfamily II)
MVSTTLLPGLVAIALPTPFAVGAVNVYLAGDTLIDCGVGDDTSYAALAAELHAVGCAITDLRRIIVTHHHIDHAGLAGRLARESGAHSDVQVWAHPLTVPHLEDPRRVRHKDDAYTSALFAANGVPAALITRMVGYTDYLLKLTSPVPVSRTLNEGDTIEFAEREWVVLHTPGHAGDLICLYQPDTAIMLSSDHLLNHISSNALLEAPAHRDDPRPKRLLDYAKHLRRIAEYDIRIAYTGHGDPVTDIPALVSARLESMHKRADRLYDLFEGRPHTLYALTQKMFPRAAESDPYLAMSEVLGHLDLLEEQGRATVLYDNGETTFIPR